VVVDEVDGFEDIDEEELARCALLRGMNILATSSAFMAVRPPWPTLTPHADRLFCWKLGGFATAVICEAVEGIGYVSSEVWMMPANTTGILSIPDSPNTSTQRLVDLDSRPPPARRWPTGQSLSWILMKMMSEGCWRAALLRDVSSLSSRFCRRAFGGQGRTPARTGSVCLYMRPR